MWFMLHLVLWHSLYPCVHHQSLSKRGILLLYLRASKPHIGCFLRNPLTRQFFFAENLPWPHVWITKVNANKPFKGAKRRGSDTLDPKVSLLTKSDTFHFTHDTIIFKWSRSISENWRYMCILRLLFPIKQSFTLCWEKIKIMKLTFIKGPL